MPARRWLPIAGLLVVVAVAGWWLSGLEAGGGGAEVVRPGAARADRGELPRAGGADRTAVERIGVESLAAADAADVAEPDVASAAADTGSLLVRIRWSDGSPAADVGFVLMQWAQANPFLHAIKERTDAAGEFLADPAVPGKVTLYGNRGGSESGEVTAGEQTRLELTLPPGRLVQGRVVDEREAPVPGAEVWLSAPFNRSEGQVVTQTDAAGQFRIEEVGAGHDLGARHPRYQPSALTTLDDAAAEPLRLVLRAGGTRLRGWVGDAEGEPVAGASVLVGAHASWDPVAWSDTAGPPPVPTVTGPDGTFALDGLPAGTCSVEARAPDHAATNAMIVLREGEATDVTLTLGAGCVVAGAVHDSDGQAIAQAWITFGDDGDFSGSSALTDAEGRYRLPDLPAGTLHLTAAHHDYLLTSTQLPVEPGVEAEWNPVLASGLSIEGVVVDRRTGAPLGGRVVRAEVVRDPQDRGPVWSGSARTDDEGRFAISGLHDEVHQVEVHDPEHFTGIADATVDAVRPGGPPLRIAVENGLLARGAVTGRVVDQRGGPVADGWVGLSRPGVETRIGARLQADGRFQADGLAPGAYVVQPSVKGATTSAVEVIVQPDVVTDLGDLRITAGGVVVARVRPEPGIDLDTVYIHLISDSTGYTFRTSREGDVYRSDPMAAGTYVLAVLGTSAAAQRTSVEVEPGGEHQLDLPLVAGTSLMLRYDWPDRASRPRVVKLTITDGAGEVRYLGTARGSADIDPIHTLALEPGAYVLQITDPDRPHAPMPFDVVAGPRQIVTIDMR